MSNVKPETSLAGRLQILETISHSHLPSRKAGFTFDKATITCDMRLVSY